MFSLIIYILIAALGFIMVFLFRQTNTSADILRPNPVRLRRIFIFIFSGATIVTFALSWFTTYQLGTSNIPLEGAIKFQNMKSVMIFVMNLSFFLMILLANAYSLTVKRLSLLPYFLALIFYVGFVLKEAYIISNYFQLWQQSLKLFKGNLPDFHSTAWIKCGLGALVTFLNAGMIWWGVRK